MTVEINVGALVGTIVAAVMVGLFWRIFNMSDKYMTKKDCELKRAGDADDIKALTKSVNEVHKRVDAIYKMLAESASHNKGIIP